MKTKLFFAAATLALALSASADDQLRNVQTELKSQGFYYGDVDGQSGAETTSAIRRYQIRNGLEVTGTLTPETLGTLGTLGVGSGRSKGGSAAEQKKPAPAVNIRRDESVEESDRAFLRREEIKDQSKNPPSDSSPPKPGSHDFFANPPTPTAPPHDPSAYSSPTPRDSSVYAPPVYTPPVYSPPPATHDYSVITPPGRRDSSVISPPAPLDAPSADFPVLFAGTPYASAPLPVQRDTLRRAQSILYGRGYYRDIVDGLPGPATEEALLTFQRAVRLTLSGRLDMDTLNQLRLLPGNSGTQFGVEFRSPRHVFRGVWVERD